MLSAGVQQCHSLRGKKKKRKKNPLSMPADERVYAAVMSAGWQKGRDGSPSECVEVHDTNILSHIHISKKKRKGPLEAGSHIAVA